MPRILIMAVFVLLMAVPIAAQEETCEIDLSEVESLLEEAQAAATSGDTATALDQIAGIQEALEAIVSGCSTREVTLDATFEAQDGSLSLNYPEDWELDDSEFNDSSEGIVFLANSRAALELALSVGNDPVLASGQQIIGVLRNAEMLATDLGEDAGLEEVLTSLYENAKEEFPSISDIEYFSVNDRRAGQIEVPAGTFDGLFLIIEFRAGERYIGVISISAPGELDALRPIAFAIAESIRVER